MASLDDEISENVREFFDHADSVSKNEDVYSWVSDHYTSHDIESGSSEYWELANEGKENHGGMPDCRDVQRAVAQLVDDAIKSRITGAIDSVIREYDLDDYDELTTDDPRQNLGPKLRTYEHDDEVDVWRTGPNEYVGWKFIDVGEHGLELWGRVDVDIDDNLEQMEEACEEEEECDPPSVISSPKVTELPSGALAAGESKASAFAKRWARK